VECAAHHPDSRGVTDIISVTMSLLSTNLAVATFPPEQSLLRMTCCYIIKGSKPVQTVWRERVELLIELFGRYFENLFRHLSGGLVHEKQGQGFTCIPWSGFNVYHRNVSHWTN